MSYTFKQIQSGSGGSGVTGCGTAAFSSTAGSLLIAWAWGSAAATVTVSDGSNTYNPTGAQIVDSTNGAIAQLFYAYNTTALSSHNVALNFSVAQNYPQIVVCEYAGIMQTSDPFIAAGSMWNNHEDPNVVGPTSGGAIYTNNVGPMTVYPCLAFGIAASDVGSKPTLVGYNTTVRSNTIVSGYAVCGDYELTASNKLKPMFDNNAATTNTYLACSAAFAEIGAVAPPTVVPCGFMQTYAMR